MMPTSVTKELKSESLQLLREYQKTPSAEVRNRLVQLNLGLVRKEAHHWINQCTENYEDLLQVGSLGLIRADQADVQQHVTAKALDGLFFMIGEEEKKIRADPLKTGSAILRRVFGG